MSKEQLVDCVLATVCLVAFFCVLWIIQASFQTPNRSVHGRGILHEQWSGMHVAE